MSTPRLWATLAILLPVLGALIAGLSAVDLAYHVRAGNEILAGAGIPTRDGWTYTAYGAPWFDQQWAAQTLFAGVDRVGGWAGLFVLRALLVGGLFGLVFAIARLRGASMRVAAWTTLGAFFVTAVALALRPQLIGMVLFAGTIAVLAARRGRPGLVWLIPGLVIVWANVHGSFFLAPLAVGLAWLEDRMARAPGANRLLIVAVVSVACALVNPAGIEVWRYAIGLSMNPEVTRRITEWQPTTLRDVPGLLFFVSAAIVAIVLLRSGRAIPWTTLLWLGVFGAMGVYAVRGVAWWPIVVAYAIAPFLAGASAPSAPAGRPGRPVPIVVARANAAIVVGVGLAIVALLPWWRSIDPGTNAPMGVVADAPSGISTALRRTLRPGDRILNPQPWGSWLELSFPEATVAIDSRIELFPVSVWNELAAIDGGSDGWQDAIGRWAPTIAVLARADTGLRARLAALGWTTFYDDGDGLVLEAPGR